MLGARPISHVGRGALELLAALLVPMDLVTTFAARNAGGGNGESEGECGRCVFWLLLGEWRFRRLKPCYPDL